MPPRRKPLLSCLDLEESELQGDHDDAPRQKLRRRTSDEDTRNKSGDSAASTKHDPPPSKKKEKEFAWMDSDAEDSDSENKHELKKKNEDDPVGLFEDASRKSSKKARSRSRSSSSGGPPLPASVTEVENFSQMVRMAESLKKRVRSMAPTELVQCLAASARVKFFDGNFLQDMLIPQVQRQFNISRKKSAFTTDEIVTILCSLAELNCFDKKIFVSCVKELADRRYLELKNADKMGILAAFKAVKYECDEDRQFYEWLSSSVKAERYETLSAEQRMIVGNSKSGMTAPEGYLRSFMIVSSKTGSGSDRSRGSDQKWMPS